MNNFSPRLAAFVTVLLLAVIPAGCGESDEEQAQDVIDTYVQAREANDYGRICDLFGEEIKRQLGVAEDCETKIEAQVGGAASEGELEIVSVRVREGRGVAELDLKRGSEAPSRISLLLEEQEGDWVITGLQ